MTQADEEWGRLVERFDPFASGMEEHVFEVTEELRERCPLAHGENQDGF